jgi:hypothetical protein
VKYLEALAVGPRAVATLYLEVTNRTKEPALGKSARRVLQTKPSGD